MCELYLTKENCRKNQFGQNLPTLPQTAKHIKLDKRMTHIEDIQAKQQQQLDFFIRTSTPPAEMVFFEGDFYTARAALENLVRTANHRVIIIDGYVSSLTLPQQSYRHQKMA